MKYKLKKVFLLGFLLTLSLLLMACSKGQEGDNAEENLPPCIKSQGYGLYDEISENGEKTHYKTSNGWLRVTDNVYGFSPTNSDYDEIGFTYGTIEKVSGTKYIFKDNSGKTFDVIYEKTSTEFSIEIKTDTVTLCFLAWNDK